MASDDSRGVVRKMNGALDEQPEVSLPKARALPPPRSMSGGRRSRGCRSVTWRLQRRSRWGRRLSWPAA
eukprot:9893747-Alexandrium_andersonii.AAC.1